MREEPFISVVMPVYNAQCYLDESVKSVLNQTFSNIELILVDDCSKDKSGEICDSWALADKRVKVVHLKKNRGAGNARNTGIELASGVYLAFMDADDYIEENLYHEAVLSIGKSNLDMVIWGLTEDYYNNDNKLVLQNVLSLEKRNCRDLVDVRKMVIELERKTLFGYQWNRLYRMELIKENNIRFEDSILYEDFFFNVLVIKYIQSMSILESSAYHYKKRMNESITARFVPEYFKLSTRRVHEMYELYSLWGMCTKDVKDILGNIYLRYILSALMRNFDNRSNMTVVEIKEWLLAVITTELYGAVSKYAAVKSKSLKVFRFFLNHRSVNCCCLMGKVAYWLKVKFPIVFSRARINK
ncbi:glycosyltransferase family 2 protein [Lactonifactor longoviformis]|uniref:glycosyltransferase family 2 protein n=1 Tax=Lactonifactor longoviformis TaxID=341220 RepID=UPI001D023B11|nr:glycosyltransferase family 2 protein [Lactonifactor longoviformis]MCB5712148.1 glycosyltransferase [Lactonifactor longoviformis]MCB5716192.1 glycosyltransferase [Lactonifactor longoviformis]